MKGWTSNSRQIEHQSSEKEHPGHRHIAKTQNQQYFSLLATSPMLNGRKKRKLSSYLFLVALSL